MLKMIGISTKKRHQFWMYEDLFFPHADLIENTNIN